MLLCLFELLESFPLEELVGRTDPLEPTHLEIFEELSVSVVISRWFIIDIREVYRAIR